VITIMTRPVIFAAGASTGLSIEALAEALRSVSWAAVLSFACNAILTGVACYAAYRTARREQDQKDRDAERAARLEDFLQEQRLRNPTLPTPETREKP
jgi:hypothetical protein